MLTKPLRMTAVFKRSTRLDIVIKHRWLTLYRVRCIKLWIYRRKGRNRINLRNCLRSGRSRFKVFLQIGSLRTKCWTLSQDANFPKTLANVSAKSSDQLMSDLWVSIRKAQSIQFRWLTLKQLRTQSTSSILRISSLSLGSQVILLRMKLQVH